MTLWTSKEIRQAISGEVFGTFEVNRVVIDSRQVQKGDLFVALKGSRQDGHAFVQEALQKGAAVLIAKELSLPEEAAVIRVADCLKALEELAFFGRNRFKGKIVAVTGSLGKTTQKEMLRAIFSSVGKAHAATASFNNTLGVSLTLANLPIDADFAVTEVGMNRPGEIRPLARMIKPHVGIITVIEAVHLEYMKTLAGIAEEKSTLLTEILPGGYAVLPADSPFFKDFYLKAIKTGLTVWGAGFSEGADFRIRALHLTEKGSEMTVQALGKEVKINLPIPGRHMAFNAVSALAAAVAAGTDFDRAVRALSSFAAVSGRGLMRRMRLKGDREILLIDESYNAAPASIRQALQVLKLQTAGRHVVVLGDILELGESSAAEHRALAPDVAEAAEAVFTCGPQMQNLHEALPASLQKTHATDALSLAPAVAEALMSGDVVLVKGSRGSQTDKIIAYLEKEASGHVL